MTRHELPPCSVRNCPHPAGAVINGKLLCGAHATDALTFLQERRRPGPSGKPR